ncbi:hypothetical protein [Pantoea sp. BAV 3049]|uniref:hypothetical protein n=1 Tax=Pantoea sp. BAV 3049 TaxID=2654188 RepID=UPI00131DB5FF|nr:hypothetical protein [Pantoea sp. BAV 3049]
MQLEILIPMAILFLNYLLAVTLIFLSFFMWEGRKDWFWYLNIASSVALLSTLLFFIWPRLILVPLSLTAP